MRLGLGGEGKQLRSVVLVEEEWSLNWEKVVWLL